MVDEQVEEIWFDHFDTDSSDQDDEDDIYYSQNLGSESPWSATAGSPIPFNAINPTSARSSLTASSIVNHQNNRGPTRSRIWRSLSFDRKKHEFSARGKSSLSSSSTTASPYGRKGTATSKTPHQGSRDCSICFGEAKIPRRTSCCNSVFCYEHIADWLRGMSPEGHGFCPACNRPCSLDTDVLQLRSIGTIPTPSPLVAVADTDTGAGSLFSSPVLPDILGHQGSLQGDLVITTKDSPADDPIRNNGDEQDDDELSPSSDSSGSTTLFSSIAGEDVADNEEDSPKAPLGQSLHSHQAMSHTTANSAFESEFLGRLCTMIGAGMLLYMIFHNGTLNGGGAGMGDSTESAGMQFTWAE